MKRGLMIAATVVVAGCGGFLSAFGEDPQPDPAPDVVDLDASSETTAADGGASVDGTISGDANAADAIAAGDAKGDGGPSLRVFVTSDTFAATELQSPDGLCASIASGLNGYWRAWISHPARQATNVLGSANGPWRRLDDVLVAADKAQLLSGKLASTINIDQMGNPRDAFVWTGTSTTGIDLGHCNRWGAEDGGFAQGTYGRSAASDADWTNAGETICANSFAIYCFEIPGP